MNADEPEQKAADSLSPFPDALVEKVASASPRSGMSAWPVWAALLLAALALMLAGWMWWQSQQAQQQQTAQQQAQQQHYQEELKRLESALAAVQSSAGQQSSTLSGDLQQRVQALEAEITAAADFRSESAAWTRSAQATLEDSQLRLKAVDERLRTLSARSAEADAELELEEIDYLLRMAQERLQLFGDTRNADRALQLADQQVLAFDNPMFIGLRREIAAARQALAATDQVDMVALGAELDRIQDGLSGLPFRTGTDDDQTPASSTNATGAELPWWDRLKNILSGLVTVRRVHDAELALPALADQQALRQRAWLQVEQARLAALSREQTLYQDSLTQAQATISRWFSSDDPQVQQMLGSLQALQQRNVDPPMPDISAPWVTLRSLRDAGLSPAAAAPLAPAPPPAQEPAERQEPEAQQEPAAQQEPEAQQEPSQPSDTTLPEVEAQPEGDQ